MSGITDEVIFYSGIVITGAAVLFTAIYFFISKIKGIQLAHQLEQEYGEESCQK